MPMIREDGKTERQMTARPPAWLGGQTSRPATSGSGGNGNGNGGTVPAWLQAIRNRLNNDPLMATTSLGGGNAMVPNFNTQASITQGQQTYAQNNPTPNVVAAPAPIRTQNQAPAWMQAISNRVNTSPYLSPAGGFGNTQPVPNFYSPTNDGNQRNPNEQGTTEQGTSTQGTNSFIGSGGEAVLGSNGSQAYFPWTPAGVNTFIGAGGQAVRGPQAYQTIGNFQSGDVNGGSQAGGGGGGSGGFGSNYGGNWRRGGGGGGGGGYGYGNNYDSPAWLKNDPQYMNLYSLNWKG